MPGLRCSIDKESVLMTDISERARLYATSAHGEIGQVRKYDNEPYITHPAAVVEIVKSVPHDDAMLAAAWLHDVVEDTPRTLDEIRAEFGDDVADMVSDLTDVSKPPDGNRATRKAIDRHHTQLASPRAKTIKLADLIDNTRSIVQRDPDFARVYLTEKNELLKVLTEGDLTLWHRANNMVVLGMFGLVG